MSRDLREKSVLITGAASGIGKALAFRFSAEKCFLTLMDKDKHSLEDAGRELASAGANVITVPGDVSEYEDCQRTVEEAKKTYGGVDILINNAGITHRSAFSKTDYGVFHKVMAVNYFGSVHCTKAALSSLVERKGMIIVTSSIAGFAPLLGRTGYSAAKHALHGLFESLRAELTGTGVHILIVCPGFTSTNIEKNALGENGKPTSHPQSRVGKSLSADEVAYRIYKAAEAEKRLLILSLVGKITYFLMKIYPTLYTKIMRSSLRSELERS